MSRIASADARRQRRARVRFDALEAFYGEHPSRMARLHRLTAAAVTLGRFCAVSESFDRIGDRLMPARADGRPRTAAWARYAAACAAGRPWVVRDELWIDAHLRDMRRVRAEGLLEAFDVEAAARRDDPFWRLLRQHMEVTIGARAIDDVALTGAIAGETAIADAMGRSLLRLLRGGARLVARFVVLVVRAFVAGDPDDRRVAVTLVTTLFTAWTAASVFRRGVALRHRGRAGTAGDAWPLLAEVLGAGVVGVSPSVVAFYENPGRFSVRAWLDLHTAPARIASRALTWLTGQGMFEASLGRVDARFRVFRRSDGSMHFVRELFCRGALRVFDSDFVVEPRAGRATLIERFAELGVDVEMDVRVLAGGALAIRGRRVLVFGIPAPTLGLVVEFVARRGVGAGGAPAVLIDGHLRHEPATRLGRAIHRALGLAVELGCIHYVATAPRRAAPAVAAPRPAPVAAPVCA